MLRLRLSMGVYLCMVYVCMCVLGGFLRLCITYFFRDSVSEFLSLSLLLLLLLITAS